MTKLGHPQYRELRIIALQRSGNHAISHWLMAQISGAKFYLNNARTRGGSPYRCFELLDSEWAPTRVIGFEDHTLDHLRSYLRWRDRDYPNCVTNIVVVRDAANQLASRIANGQCGARMPLNIWADTWIQYASAYKHGTSDLSSPTLFVDFNRWVSSVNYRRYLCEELEIDFNDKLFTVRINFPWERKNPFLEVDAGDTFNVQNRWKLLKDKEDYRAIYRGALRRLDHELFGRQELDLATSGLQVAPSRPSIQASAEPIPANALLQVESDIIEARFSRVLALLHPDDGRYLATNQLGRNMWISLREGSTMERLKEMLCEKSDFDANASGYLVKQYVQTLRDYGLVKIS